MPAPNLGHGAHGRPVPKCVGQSPSGDPQEDTSTKQPIGGDREIRDHKGILGGSHTLQSQLARYTGSFEVQALRARSTRTREDRPTSFQAAVELIAAAEQMARHTAIGGARSGRETKSCGARSCIERDGCSCGGRLTSWACALALAPRQTLRTRWCTASGGGGGGKIFAPSTFVWGYGQPEAWVRLTTYPSKGPSGPPWQQTVCY
jgi:hypothetical protein